MTKDVRLYRYDQSKNQRTFLAGKFDPAIDPDGPLEGNWGAISIGSSNPRHFTSYIVVVNGGLRASFLSEERAREYAKSIDPDFDQFRIAGPGEYTLRNGEEVSILRKVNLREHEGVWLGVISKDGYDVIRYWHDNGKPCMSYEPHTDVVNKS